jgi:alanine-glyoxylate transaminase/(R)-3-amino-2-methylpropionate-pyruvate transaminase
VIGDVRGKGLMIGVEMVESKTGKQPLRADVMMDIWESCRDMGLLIGKGGVDGNVFRIKPPMCISKQDVDFAIAVFKMAVEDAMKKL